MAAYYNEFDPFAAAWLRALISKGHLPAGEVDERSICDVSPDDLRDFQQCHFFAGIGGWPYALRLAGFPDDREVWTGSCPCQPLSCAGQQKGHADERHLWPAFYALIAERKPAIVFGEQVAGALGHEWLAGVRADLETSEYACGAADMPACSVGAPHIRQRLYWCAVDDALFGRHRDANETLCARRIGVELSGLEHSTRQSESAQRSLSNRPQSQPTRRSSDVVADADSRGCPGRSQESQRNALGGVAIERAGGDMADDGHDGWPSWGAGREHEKAPSIRPQRGSNSAREFWSDAEWLTGADGKARRVKSGVRLLVDGLSSRMGRLRGYGNAIVPQAAQAFIETMMEIIP